MNGRIKVEVPLAVVGCDFRVAPTHFREQLVSTAERRLDLFQAIQRIDPTAGFMALETCNRTEWMVSTEHPSWMAELLHAQMVNLWKDTLPGLSRYPNPVTYLNAHAVRHVYRLVMGLESLATGEAQIAGQFQSAMVQARQEHTLSALLSRLGSGAGRLAKAGSRLGFRSNHRTGIHGLACGYFHRYFHDKGPQCCIGVVGMGSIGRKTAQMLEESGKFRVMRVNRTVREEHVEKWQLLENLPSLSRAMDGLIVATGGLQPVVTSARLDLSGRNEPLTIVDIGVPRQVDAAVQNHSKVLYRNLDDLVAWPREEIESESMREVDAEVEKEVDRFLRFCMERDMLLLLERIHQGRREFNATRIPAQVAAGFGDLDEKTRAQVESAIKQSIADYAGEIHQALQLALEGFWGHR